MDENAIQDLKQFITSTISQQTANLATKEDVLHIEKKIDELSDSVAEALETTNETSQSLHDDHESRITKLEQRTA